MLTKKGIATLACFAGAPLIAQAAPWSGDIALGYLATTGNTETSSVNSRASLVYAHERWKNTSSAKAVHTQDARGSGAENYAASEQLDFNFTPRNYGFIALEWNKDIYAAIRERTSETLGYGRHVLMGPAHRLDLEMGAGARQSVLNERPRRHEDDAIARGAVKYQWSFSPTSSFQQAMLVESGEANTYTESLSALKLAVIGNVYANVSYTIKSNTKTADDTRKTDSELALTLSYEFGKSAPPG